MKNTDLRSALNDPSIQIEKLDDGTTTVARIADIVETIEEHWKGRVQVRKIAGHIHEGESKYCIVEVLPDNREEPIFWVKDDESFTGEVIERIFMADNSQGHVLSQMQARNAAVRVLQRKVAKDKMDEANDVAVHVLKSPLNKYKVNDNLIIRDYGNIFKK